MKQVVKKILPVLAMLVFVGAGCSSATNPTIQTPNSNTSQPSTETSAPQSTENKVAAMDCKDDTACADIVWSGCKPGSFNFGQGGMNIATVMVSGKQDNHCMVTWNYSEDYLKQGGPNGETYKGLSMTCAVIYTDKTAMAGFGNFMKSEVGVGFKDCGGALKDVMSRPASGAATLRD